MQVRGTIAGHVVGVMPATCHLAPDATMLHRVDLAQPASAGVEGAAVSSAASSSAI
jgi:hypothetical protein